MDVHLSDMVALPTGKTWLSKYSEFSHCPLNHMGNQKGRKEQNRSVNPEVREAHNANWILFHGGRGGGDTCRSFFSVLGELNLRSPPTVKLSLTLPE